MGRRRRCKNIVQTKNKVTLTSSWSWVRLWQKQGYDKSKTSLSLPWAWNCSSPDRSLFCYTVVLHTNLYVVTYSYVTYYSMFLKTGIYKRACVCFICSFTYSYVTYIYVTYWYVTHCYLWCCPGLLYFVLCYTLAYVLLHTSFL